MPPRADGVIVRSDGMALGQREAGRLQGVEAAHSIDSWVVHPDSTRHPLENTEARQRETGTQGVDEVTQQLSAMPPPKVSKTEAKARRHVYSSGLQGCGGGSSEVRLYNDSPAQ